MKIILNFSEVGEVGGMGQRCHVKYFVLGFCFNKIYMHFEIFEIVLPLI